VYYVPVISVPFSPAEQPSAMAEIVASKCAVTPNLLARSGYWFALGFRASSVKSRAATVFHGTDETNTSVIIDQRSSGRFW
jgi:hypothetical protein